MPEPSNLGLVLMLVGFGLLVWLGLLPIFMYNRVKGIERALWAVVTQLRAMRREEYEPVQAAQTRSGHDAPAPSGSIKLSMFGR